MLDCPKGVIPERFALYVSCAMLQKAAAKPLAGLVLNSELKGADHLIGTPHNLLLLKSTFILLIKSLALTFCVNEDNLLSGKKKETKENRLLQRAKKYITANIHNECNL